MFNQKVNQSKLMDENWKLKMEEIQRKKKQQYKQTLEKSKQYRR